MPAISDYFSSDYLGDWKPVSRTTGISWIVVFALFLLYAALNAPHILFVDFANLAIHEAGHPIFGIFAGPDETGFGYVLMIFGGTLAELLAPLSCFAYFFFKRETTGVAFCTFWLFENFLYIGTYMADARTLALPLVGSGDHDWEILFTHWNVLMHAEQIGHTTRFLGWLGMLVTIAWLAYRIRRSLTSDQS